MGHIYLAENMFLSDFIENREMISSNHCRISIESIYILSVGGTNKGQITVKMYTIIADIVDFYQSSYTIKAIYHALILYL